MLAFELALSPAREIEQRLDHRIFRIRRHVLPGRTVALDRDRHAVFVIVSIPMRDAGAELVEVAALNCMERIRDAVKFDLFGSVVPNSPGCSLGMPIVAFEAGLMRSTS